MQESSNPVMATQEFRLKFKASAPLDDILAYVMEVIELTRGHYGAERFAEFFGQAA